MYERVNPRWNRRLGNLYNPVARCNHHKNQPVLRLCRLGIQNEVIVDAEQEQLAQLQAMALDKGLRQVRRADDLPPAWEGRPMHLVGFETWKGQFNPIHCTERVEGALHIKALAAQYVPSQSMVELADVAETQVRVENSQSSASGSGDRIPIILSQSQANIDINIDNIHRHVLMYKTDPQFTDDFDVADLEAYCDECRIAFLTPARGLRTCRYPGCHS